MQFVTIIYERLDRLTASSQRVSGAQPDQARCNNDSRAFYLPGAVAGLPEIIGHLHPRSCQGLGRSIAEGSSTAVSSFPPDDLPPRSLTSPGKTPAASMVKVRRDFADLSDVSYRRPDSRRRLCDAVLYDRSMAQVPDSPRRPANMPSSGYRLSAQYRPGCRDQRPRELDDAGGTPAGINGAYESPAEIRAPPGCPARLST